MSNGCAMHFGNNSRWWTVEKRKCFFTSWVIKNNALLVKNLSGKILYLCILTPQSEYIRICHWKTIFHFRYFKIAVMTRYRKQSLPWNPRAWAGKGKHWRICQNLDILQWIFVVSCCLTGNAPTIPWSGCSICPTPFWGIFKLCLWR